MNAESVRKISTAKTLEKHMLACKGTLAIPVQMEAHEDVLRDAVHCTEDIKPELRILTPTDKAILTYDATVPNSTVVTTEVSFKVVNTMDKINTKVPKKTLPYDEVRQQMLDGDKDTLKESSGVDETSDESKLKPTTSEILTTPPAIKIHLRNSQNKEDENILRYDICDETFTEPSSLVDHHTRHLQVKTQESNHKHAPRHPPLKPYKCTQCEAVYTSARNLRRHMVMHTARYKCDRCSKKFLSPGRLDDHIRLHLGIKPFQCTECMAAYASARNLKRHMVTHTSRYKCDRCSKKFQSSAKFKEHMRRHMGIKPHQCTLCKAAFVCPSALRRHEATHSKKHKCDVCEREFLTKATLQDHRYEHLGGKIHECVECKRSFLTSESLGQHKESFHKSEFQTVGTEENSSNNIGFENKNTNSKQQNGTNCFNDFEKRADNQAEKSEAMESTSHRCEHCNKIHLSAHDLKEHIQRHMGIKPHQCTLCKAAFVSARGLMRHETRHSKNTLHKSESQRDGSDENSSYNSEFENKTTSPKLVKQENSRNSFNDLAKLADNTSKKPEAGKSTSHKCEHCNKTFLSARDLKEHIHRHLGIKPHKCTLCKASFVSARELKRHVATHDKNALNKSESQREGSDENSSNISEFENKTTSPKQENGRNSFDDLAKPTDTTAKDNEARKSTSHSCEHCNKKFLSTRDLQEHIQRHLIIKSHQCTSCKAAFVSAIGLKRHVATHSKKDYQCDGSVKYIPNNTGYVTDDVEKMAYNEAKKTEETKSTCHRCQHCNKTFLCVRNLKEHVQRHLGIKPYQCSECMAAYTSASTLKRHMVTHTSLYKCEHCSKTCQSPGQLEDHIRRHRGIKPHQCTLCKAAFVSARGLKLHETTHSKNKADYRRDYSEKNSSNNIGLLNKSTYPNPPLKCTFCTRTFLFRNAFRNHKKKCRIHQYQRDRGQRHFSKHIEFEKKTKSRNEENEKNSHQSERNVKEHPDVRNCGNVSGPGPNYTCSFCPKAFTNRYSLSKHLNSHTNRFKCEYCTKRFQSACRLQKHIIIHLRMGKKTSTIVLQKMDGQKVNSTPKSIELDNTVNVVQLETQDSTLKDAICFEDEQEFKPIVNVADDIFAAQIFNSKNDDGSRIATETSGQERILYEKISKECKSDNVIKMEIECSEEQISPFVLCADLYQREEINNLKEVRKHSETRRTSEKVYSFDETSHTKAIKKERNSSPVDESNATELSDNLEFLSDNEASISGTQCEDHP